jgi:hypothetical protein
MDKLSKSKVYLVSPFGCGHFDTRAAAMDWLVDRFNSQNTTASLYGYIGIEQVLKQSRMVDGETGAMYQPQATGGE